VNTVNNMEIKEEDIVSIIYRQSSYDLVYYKEAINYEGE
jgi:hypothetical protein